MVRVVAILGRVDEPRFAQRRVEKLAISWDEASKRRLRRMTDQRTDVAIAVPRDMYLADGAVLDDDGERIIAVVRPQERALRIRFDASASTGRQVRAAVIVGHAFGNQHVPLDLSDSEVLLPLTTSEDIALATVRDLDLAEVQAEIVVQPLGTGHPLVGHGGHAH
jgi:urease accessory protein